MLLDYVMHIPPERKKKSHQLCFLYEDLTELPAVQKHLISCSAMLFHFFWKPNTHNWKKMMGFSSCTEVDHLTMKVHFVIHKICKIHWTGHHNWDLTKETQECYSFLLFRCLMKFPLLNTSVSVFNFFQISPVASPFFKNNSKGPSDNLNIFLFLFLFCSNSVFMYSYPALSST